MSNTIVTAAFAEWTGRNRPDFVVITKTTTASGVTAKHHRTKMLDEAEKLVAEYPHREGFVNRLPATVDGA
jgi:hypothetical protein